ncbi:MAG TPA: hypothetical protein VFL36_02990 [Myxococcales bacterium]|nr:hypothetical protein [Myxococcales bacterium]
MTWTLLLLLAAPLRPAGSTAMKQVVCRQIDEARGRSGAELAQAIEAEVLRFAKAKYALSALLPGDPPIACFRSTAEEGKLPRGAR